MLTKEIAAGLIHWARRVDDAQRRVRSGHSPDRVRYAAQCRREAFRYLVMACGSLKAWPVTAQVGPEAVLAAHGILLAADGSELRRILPLVTVAAQQHRIPALHLAEAVDALCVAEKRPQVYGTVTGHPVGDASRVRAKRAALGLPLPTAPDAATGTRRARPDDPVTSPDPEPWDGMAVLDGLLADLPPVPPLPRTVRRTVGPDADWSCAYCGGPAGAGSPEIEVRARVWRICPVCARCPDTPEARLLDVLTTKGGVPASTARATAALARHEGWRLPLRYEEPRTRPDRRPQPRWLHIPDTAVGKLVLLAEQRRPAVTPVAMPARRADPRAGTHPGLLVSPKALALLALAPHVRLTPKEVGRALQLAPPTLAGHGLRVTNAGELRSVFVSPPHWLLDFHRRLAAQRAANRSGQLGAPPAARATVPGQGGQGGQSGQSGQARASGGPQTPTEAAEPAEPALPVLGPPHPEMLVSSRAEQVLGRPHDDVLAPNVVSKSLQTAHATLVKRRLAVGTVAELHAVFHRPPDWLLDFHRKLAAERAANLLRQVGEM